MYVRSWIQHSHLESPSAMLQFTIAISLVLVGRCLCQPTRGVKFTLYEERRTWNEARCLCEAHGQVMLKLDTLKKYDYFMTIANQWKENTSLTHDMWLGLHLREANTSSFQWHDCEALGNWTVLGNWTIWGPDEPDSILTDQCIRLTKADRSFRTRKCNVGFQVACEEGVPCTFEEKELRKFDTDIKSSFKTLNECKQFCLDFFDGTMECIAFEYIDKDCRIFPGELVYVNDDPILTPSYGSGAIVFIKRCIFGNYSVNVTGVANNTNLEPISTCTSMHFVPCNQTHSGASHVSIEQHLFEASESQITTNEITTETSMVSMTTDMTLSSMNDDSSKIYSTETTVHGYSPESTVQGYLTETTVQGYLTETTVPGYSTETTVPGYSTETTVAGYSTETTVPAYSTETTVPAYSTETTVPEYSTETTVPEYSTETTDQEYSNQSQTSGTDARPSTFCACIHGNSTTDSHPHHLVTLLNKKTLSSYWRSKNCAEDHRTDSQTIGAFGIGIMIGVMVFIMFLDCDRVFRDNRCP